MFRFIRNQLQVVRTKIRSFYAFIWRSADQDTIDEGKEAVQRGILSYFGRKLGRGFNVAVVIIGIVFGIVSSCITIIDFFGQGSQFVQDVKYLWESDESITVTMEKTEKEMDGLKDQIQALEKENAVLEKENAYLLEENAELKEDKVFLMEQMKKE